MATSMTVCSKIAFLPCQKDNDFYCKVIVEGSSVVESTRTPVLIGNGTSQIHTDDITDYRWYPDIQNVRETGFRECLLLSRS